MIIILWIKTENKISCDIWKGKSNNMKKERPKVSSGTDPSMAFLTPAQILGAFIKIPAPWGVTSIKPQNIILDKRESDLFLLFAQLKVSTSQKLYIQMVFKLWETEQCRVYCILFIDLWRSGHMTICFGTNKYAFVKGQCFWNKAKTVFFWFVVWWMLFWSFLMQS